MSLDWLKVTPQGLYCAPADLFIDPSAPVERAVITHAHSDHARPGHAHVLATAETVALMRARMGEKAGDCEALAYGAVRDIGGVSLRLLPAGHMLGSAQVVLDHAGKRAVISGDYKRRADPTCAPFEPMPCDVFVTEATFGLPVFRHPDDRGEIDRLLHSVALYPERCHLIGAYALGKAQRLLALLRRRGYEDPVYLHGTMLAPCALYESLGVALGPVRPVIGTPREELMGKIVLAPPSAAAEPWARRLPDPVVGFASGWMRVKQRAKQRGVELPLVISDHADWDELTATIRELEPAEVWVTHGAEDALVRQANLLGFAAKPLSLHGYEAEED
jgi:putative mRNA 3-end processing factor